MLRPVSRAWRAPVSHVRVSRLAPFSTSRASLAQSYRTAKADADDSAESAPPLRGTVVPRLEVPAFDAAFEALIADVGQDGVRRLPRGKLSKARIKEITDAEAARASTVVHAQPARSPDLNGREERLSPAALLGTKRIGMATLPPPLVEGITAEIYGLDSPKFVRTAFLELLQKPKFKDQSEPKNSIQHSIAKASAFLPGQYAAVFNVLYELRQRIGADKLAEASFLEVSSALAPGLWATAEVFGVDSTAAYTVVHKTRHGLDLIRKLSEGYLPTAEVMNYIRDPNQIYGYEPTVTMSTFHLTTLVKPAARRTHLERLLETGAEHIVLVDKANPEGWAAMSEAREFLLGQSNPDAPLHITAPCPHEGACPLVGGREACIFSQRLQRPPFLRKTKHAPRGEESMSYTYLIVSRGQRPSAVASDVAVGRVGSVGRAEVERLAAKAVGHTELREVEGGGEFEMVSVPGDRAALAAAEAASAASPEVGEAKDEMEASLRAEAHSWPRLVALPLKRSGHVIIDACMPNGNLERLTVARSHGKQVYHDARKTNWGDLWPHKIKGKTTVRERGIRLLTKTPDNEVSNFDELVKAVEGEEAAEEEDRVTEKANEAEDLEDNDKEEGIFAKAEAEAQEEEIEPMSDAELDALLKSIGVDKKVVGELIPSDEPPTPDFNLFDHIEPVKPDGTPAPRTRGRVRPGRMGRTSRPTVPPTTTPGSGQKREMSARPAESTGRPKVTVSTLQKLHDAGTPITMLTAYDYPTALVSSRAGIDILLIGDSMAQVALGHHTTVPLTLDDMIYHTRAVVRAASAASGGSGVSGAGGPFILADMPFGYAESSVRDGVLAAVRLLKEGGADGVKIEGGRELLPLVQRLTESGVPVMPHIGLQPQRAAATGYKVQAKSASAAADLLETALELQEAGAFGLLLEAIPHPVATAIAKRVAIPTIGIGAGPHTSGQVLVLTDMLGVYDMRPTPPQEFDEPEPHSVGALEGLAGDALPRPGARHGADVGVIPPAGEEAPPKAPKFVRQFGAVGLETRRAVDAYIREVRARSFPAIGKETYAMPKDQLEEFLRLIEEKKDEQ